MSKAAGINIKIEVKNGELVRKGLEKLRRNVPLIARQRIYATVRHISYRMRTGDVPRPVQGYTRTGELQDGWPNHPTRTSNGYSLTNPVEHAAYVVGDATGRGQAPQNVHWPLFRDVIEDEVKQLPRKVEESIQVVARAYGF